MTAPAARGDTLPTLFHKQRPSRNVWPLAALLGLGACRAADKPAASAPAPAAPAPAAPAPAPAEETPSAGTAGDAYFSLIEPHFERVSIYQGPQVFLDQYQRTPERARHLLTAHWTASEISNGGFLQLFSGAAGVLAPEAVAGLQAIGLADNARILTEAMALLGPKYPREMDRRNRLLAARKRRQPNPFATLDEQFFQALRRHPGGFNAVAAAYARKS